MTVPFLFLLLLRLSRSGPSSLTIYGKGIDNRSSLVCFRVQMSQPLHDGDMRRFIIGAGLVPSTVARARGGEASLRASEEKKKENAETQQN